MFGSLLIVCKNFLMLFKAIAHLNLFTPSRRQCCSPFIQFLLQLLQPICLYGQDLFSVASSEKSYMFRVFGFLSDLFGISSRSLHILFYCRQFLGQSLQFFVTGFQELGKLFTILLILGASDITSRDSVVEGSDLRTE